MMKVNSFITLAPGAKCHLCVDKCQSAKCFSAKRRGATAVGAICHTPFRRKDLKMERQGAAVTGRALDYEMEWLKQGSLTEGKGSVRLTSLLERVRGPML
jgi:hypothetical protein